MQKVEIPKTWTSSQNVKQMCESSYYVFGERSKLICHLEKNIMKGEEKELHLPW
jgi:hypothetical protein